MTTNYTHDVFLCHNSQDKGVVLDLARLLKERQLAVWLDLWELQPGLPWQLGLERGLVASRAIAVLQGPHGEGPWAAEERYVALERSVRERVPVIPVLLPGLERVPDLPPFLQQRTWVDLRSGFNDTSMDRLQWGITGTRPSP